MDLLLAAWLTVSGPVYLAAGKVVEAEWRGTVSGVTAEDGQPVPWQFHNNTLLILLEVALPAGNRRRFRVERGAQGRSHGEAPVRVEDGIEHQGQESLRIATPRGTWIYHKEGAGFASLFDPDGNDWISYRPGGRAAGEFRGIPNLGVVAHPGYTGDKGSKTTVESTGPLRARLRSVSNDGKWEMYWDFFPAHARLTIVRAGEPYWLLYEGTPGGKLDIEDDFTGTSTGLKRPVTEAWTGDLPGPEWVYFGDRKLKRALFVANHQNDDANDQFYQMDGEMTVFGFGREHRCCGRYMTAAPARFSVGLIEDSAFQAAAAEIESAMATPEVRVE
jgi:hypothetical protein